MLQVQDSPEELTLLSGLPEQFRPVDPLQFLASIEKDCTATDAYKQATAPLIKGVVILVVEGERLSPL